MIYLRARFYAPEMNRFGQKDLLRGSVFAPQSLNRYLYCQNDPVNLIDPSGKLGILAATGIAAVVTGLVTGGISAYQSYKATGKVDWKQATKAAVGGAVSVAAVGLAVATGGTGLGIATMAFETYAGAKTVLRGGTVADVTTSMAKAGTVTVVAGNILPILPSAAKAVVGIGGMVGSAIKGTKDIKTAVDTFNDPTSTGTDKALSLMNLGEDVAGFIGSTALAYNGITGIAAQIKAATTAKTVTPEVNSQQGSRAVGCNKSAARGASAESTTYSSRNFRENVLRISGDTGIDKQAHHVFPQKFRTFFNSIGLDIDNPYYGSMVDTAEHQMFSYEYNAEWESFIYGGDRLPTFEECLAFARELAGKFGFSLYY